MSADGSPDKTRQVRDMIADMVHLASPTEPPSYCMEVADDWLRCGATMKEMPLDEYAAWLDAQMREGVKTLPEMLRHYADVLAYKQRVVGMRT